MGLLASVPAKIPMFLYSAAKSILVTGLPGVYGGRTSQICAVVRSRDNSKRCNSFCQLPPKSIAIISIHAMLSVGDQWPGLERVKKYSSGKAQPNLALPAFTPSAYDCNRRLASTG